MTLPSNLKKRILVIEDDQQMNDSLQRKLRKCGCETQGALNGEEGLALLQRDAYDAVLLDLMMPIKDGFVVLAQKRGTLNAETPAYVFTSQIEPSKDELARHLGARKIFKKDRDAPSEVAKAISEDLASPPVS